MNILKQAMDRVRNSKPVRDTLKVIGRFACRNPLTKPMVRWFFICEVANPQAEKAGSGRIKNVRVMIPKQRVKLADPGLDPFVPISKYYREGWFDRPDVLVSELPGAVVHVGSGMVCTSDFRVIPDFEYRLPYYPKFRKPKPRSVKSLSGTYSSVTCCFSFNIGHWWIDCLPRILLLAKAEPDKPIKLIASDSLGATHRESLELVLPRNVSVEYHPADQWLRLENFILPSVISGRCNYFLPREYYDFMREPIFRRLNLPARHEQRERIYISRARTKWRRVLNEPEVCQLLLRYGFVICELETLSFAKQVELFHKAQIVVAPHGAGINTIMFSGEIDVVVLYSTETPQNYFHTLALGMGQRHHFLTYPGDEDSDFIVDLPALEKLLNEKLGLRPNTK